MIGDPALFECYALRDAEIAAKFYRHYVEFCRANSFEVTPTTGGTLERKLAEMLKRSPERARRLGYHASKRYRRTSKLRPSNGFDALREVYFGGRNETYRYGTFPGVSVYDYDLVSAYNLALACCPEWETEKSCTFTTAKDLFKNLTDTVANPLAPLSMGYVAIDFEFPETLNYPPFPVQHQEFGLIYPRSGYAVITPQEFLVGFPATRQCHIMSCAIYTPTGATSVVSELMERIKTLRDQATNKADKNLLKILANSLYGKFVQGMTSKQSVSLKWSSEGSVKRERIPPSRIYIPALPALRQGSFAPWSLNFFCGAAK